MCKNSYYRYTGSKLVMSTKAPVIFDFPRLALHIRRSQVPPYLPPRYGQWHAASLQVRSDSQLTVVEEVVQVGALAEVLATKS